MLHVHRADRADALVTALGDLLATPLADPFAQEIVSVPTRGVERWLTQCLATRLGTRPDHADGIVANVAFPSPRQLADEAIAAACGFDPDTDPWQPQRTVWPLLELVDGALDEPWLATLAEHLQDSAGATPDGAHHRRFSAVRHIANLLDRYAIQRPQLLTAWTTNKDIDASDTALPPAALWQPELWRRLRDRIGEPDPAERTQSAITRITDNPATTAHLPKRLSIFGLTRLPPGHLDVLRAIATHRDVHLYVLHPSPALWQTIASDHPPDTTSTKRADDPTATTPRHRLLASWGRDVRELQLVLGPPNTYADEPAHADESAEPTSLLHHLQHAIRTDTPPPATQSDRPTLDPSDHSIEIHSCHGHARQVEVLRDAVLHALDEDPTLQPRDVIVMCPDIETFAPLIQATFGATAIAPTEPGTHTTKDPTDLRVRLADRATTQTNPLLGTIARLLELGDQRLTASQVLDLCDRGPIRRRFGLDDEALVRFEDWITTTNIRWGLDPEHRAPYNLDRVTANTWRAGTDRVLLGATMTEDGLPLVGGVLPLDDVESGAIDLAGRFAELVDRLKTTVDTFSTPKPMHEWATAIAQAADLLTATSKRDAWQRAALDRLLATIATDATTTTSHLDLAEARALLAEHLAGRPTRANFRTGHLTICTLHPMRTVPHRVIGLLGLDDTVFPRKTPRDSDDLLLADPFVGDHDPRTEDRQMLLDALMAAQDKLIVTYSGNDERTNAPRPPAVPVGELLDAIDRTVTTTQENERPRDQITIRHPLQPFDPRNFTPNELTKNSDTPWSFDPVTLNGARAITDDRTKKPPFLTDPLDPLTEPVVELEDLVRFVNHPAKAFLRRRLGISLGDFSDEILDALPLELDNLQKWGVGDRLLQACLAGNPRARARAAEDARGTLPPGSLADDVVTPVGRNVKALQAVADRMLARTTDLDSLDVKVTLPDGRALTGTVSGLCDDTLQTVGYSKLAPKHRLAAWVRLLALTAARPERPFEAITIGLLRAFGNKDYAVSASRIPPLGPDAETRRATALAHLATLVDLLDRGLREPPPLACVTSHAYALALRRGADPTKDAGKAWTSEYDWDKEDKDAEHVLLHGGIASLDDLLEETARPDESGADWPTAGDDKTRFGRWALRLWSGLLDVEELRDL